MSVDGTLCKMAWTALRSPSATAFRRGVAIVLVGGRCAGWGEQTETRKQKGGREAETGAEVKTTWTWCNKE